MRVDEIQPNQQEAVNDSPLRQRLLCEIGDIFPPAYAKLPLDVPEEVECGNVHPFRDLNVTNFAREADALFLHRWLKGYRNNKMSWCNRL